MNTRPEPIYYWLVCKVCHNLHSAGPVSSHQEQLMSKSKKVGCPKNPGQYAEYSPSDWRKGTLEDARKFSRQEKC
jgi:hypothetical protein